MEAEIDRKYLKAEQLLLSRVTTAELTTGNRAGFWVELGQFQLRHQKITEAVESFSQALAHDCENVDTLLLLGCALFLQDKPEDAVPLIQAVATRTDSPIAWAALGLIYEQFTAADSTGGSTVLKERAFYRANVACIGPNDAPRLAEYRTQLANLERLCGAEVPEHLSGTAALERTDTILCQLLHPSRPTAKIHTLDSSACWTESSSEVSPLFRPIEKLADYDARKRRKYHPKSPMDDNIFYYSLPYFSAWGLVVLVNRCFVKLNGVCQVNDPLFWRSALLSWMEHRRYSEAGRLLDELAALRETSTPYHVHRGTLAYIEGNVDLAAEAFDAALSADIRPWDRYPIYYRYGLMAQARKDHRKARQMFQSATELHGTATCWLGCGVASFYLNDWFNTGSYGYVDEKSKK